MKTPQSLKLSLRELFLLVAMAAIGMGWYREYRFATPMRAAYRELEADIGKHALEAVTTSGEYRGAYFEVKAMTKEYVEQEDSRNGPPGAVFVKEFQSPPEPAPAN